MTYSTCKLQSKSALAGSWHVQPMDSFTPDYQTIIRSNELRGDPGTR